MHQSGNPHRLPSSGDADELDEAMVQILREKTPAERLAIAHGMWRSARDILRNLLRAEHPDWPDERVEREAALRLSHGTQ